MHSTVGTVNWENFGVRIFLNASRYPKIKCMKFFLQRKFKTMKYLRSENKTWFGVSCLLSVLSMSIRRYFKPKDGLPDPKESLSCSLPSQAIALVNKKVINEKGGSKKRSQYGR